jgi:hypothetical protein
MVAVLLSLLSMYLVHCRAEADPLLESFAPTAEPIPPQGRLPSSAITAYSDGAMAPGWVSWSWGTMKYDQRDHARPISGAKQSLCITLAPFGAVSLKGVKPFQLGPDGGIGFFIRADGDSKEQRVALLADLEVQLEGSAGLAEDGGYRMARSATLRCETSLAYHAFASSSSDCACKRSSEL